MGSQDHRNSIIEHGDLLERHMYSNNEFAGYFSVYPIIWARHVLPNRRVGSITLTDARWLRFAERHYSAIVRCWNMMTSYKRIRQVCSINLDDVSASAHLDLHHELGSFFYFAGAAIENLEQAFAVEPVNDLDAFTRINKRQENSLHNLEWFYTRRTQYIHKVAVPVFVKGGLLTLDSSFFDDEKTEWDRAEREDADVDKLAGLLWSCFTDEMNAAWSILADIVKDVDSENEALFHIESVKQRPETWTSGSPDSPGGTTVPPSGTTESDNS